MAIVHKWGTWPIVTLISERHKWKPTWHQGPKEQTFAGHIDNILKLQVKFAWRDPDAAMAKYQVLIEKKVGDGWQSVHFDTLQFLTSDFESPQYKEYDLYQSGASFWIQHSLVFRLSVAIRKPTAASSGSYPLPFHESWTPVEISKPYTAKFRKPGRTEVAQYIERLEKSYEEIVKTLRRRMPKR